METLKSFGEKENLKENQVVSCLGKIELINSKIIFHGSGNIIFLHSNSADTVAQLVNSDICFFGSNNLLFIELSPKKYTFSLHMFNNSVCHIGANSYFNPHGEIIRLRCAEEKNIFLGNDCMFASSVELSVSDSHLIFDALSFQRINYAKSIYVGDHVWLGKSATLLKGAQIGSGAIIGTHSVVTKKVPSNTSWAGSPAKQRAENVFFVGYNAMPYKQNDIELHSKYPDDRWVYNQDNSTISFDKIEEDMKSLTSPMDKADYLKELNTEKKKNRFFIAK